MEIIYLGCLLVLGLIIYVAMNVWYIIKSNAKYNI